jgi:hypothetical protein
MTESDWWACQEPQVMLDFLRHSGKASARKLRLFAVTCCRRAWSLLDKIGKEAAEVAERYADGRAGSEVLRAAEEIAWWGADGLNYEEDYIEAAAWAVHAAVAGDASKAADWMARAAGPEEKVTFQCLILRDIFGPLPFRSLSAIAPQVLAWNGGTVQRLAQSAYDERLLPSGELDPLRLSVLADALEDAGCPADHELLLHLREGKGPHVPGCVAVDLILGRE